MGKSHIIVAANQAVIDVVHEQPRLADNGYIQPSTFEHQDVAVVTLCVLQVCTCAIVVYWHGPMSYHWYRPARSALY